MQVNVRMTLAEKTFAEKQARHLGISLSAFIRLLVKTDIPFTVTPKKGRK